MSTKDELIRELLVIAKRNAKSDLLAVLCSYGDTLTDEEVVQFLRDHNATPTPDEIKETIAGLIRSTTFASMAIRDLYNHASGRRELPRELATLEVSPDLAERFGVHKRS